MSIWYVAFAIAFGGGLIGSIANWRRDRRAHQRHIAALAEAKQALAESRARYEATVRKINGEP